MSLHLTAPAETPAPGLVRLNPGKWLDKVRAFAQLKLRKKETAAEAASVDSAHKSAMAELFTALSGAPAATCGNYVLSVKTAAPAAASITLPDGRKLAWASVTSILVGNETIPAAGITLYGGRTSNPQIDCAGG